ncbi:choice-of-anchor D domain-containing protein [Telmatobacter sp. DSM 110680]|uniref:Choice-of-anchor D domain-containing protein n=1 Tax=Telmatobacter sp. DSM 110680 TaxID=3036704 RepID=A0AAU7DD25_9BACT
MALTLGLSGCGADTKPFSSSAPSLVVSPATVDFGDVSVGQPTFRYVAISNSGTSSLEIAQLTTTSSNFVVEGGALPTTLEPSRSITVKVSYDPGTATDSVGQLSVNAMTSTKLNVTGAVKLHGKGSNSSSASLTGLSCASSSMIAAGSDSCNVTLSAPAPSGGLTVNLASSSSVVSVPTSVSVPSGATSTSFTANVSSVSTSQTVKLTATEGSVTKTTSINLTGPASQLAPSISAFACGSSSFTGAGTTSCTVSLTSPAPSSGLTVTLVSNDSAVTLPGSLTVSSGASSASLTAQVKSVSTSQTATISASANGTSQSYAMQLNAAVPALSLSATSLSFGNVTVGTAVTKSVTATSSGTVALTVNSDSISGTGFSVSGGTFPATLNPGQAMVLTVQFDPTTASASTGQLTISSNAATANVSLGGTGTTTTPTVSALSCTNNSITGSLADGCTVNLSGPAPTGGLSVSLASNNSSVTVPGSVAVPAGASTATFTANVASVSTAQTATLTANENGSSQSFALQLNAATPALTLSATSLSFGNVAVGTAVTKSVTITSSGTVAVTINSDSISGSGFSVSGGSFPATLNPGQAAVVTVQFDPTTASASTGQLTISSNAPNTTVSLSGTGTTITPTVSALACSSTSITGSLADNCTVSLSGSAPTGGVSVSITSSGSAVTVPVSITVPATATSASFTANVSAVTSAQTITLTAASGSTSQSASLQLNAATPALSLNATSIAFGPIVINNATTQTVTMTSTGTAPVTVNAVTVTGSGFTVTPVSLPATLNPGQTMNITMTFDPTATGPATGQLTVSSNSSANSTATVALSGTGNPHQVLLNWGAPSGTSDPIAGYNIYRALGGTTSFAVVNSMDVLTAFTDSNVQSGQSYEYYVTSVDSTGVESTPSNTTTVTVP